MDTIDLNCDMGEGAGKDALLMPYISSCSIACGGHVGDEDSIKASLLLAKQFGVKVGAHPAYPDSENFGTRLEGKMIKSLLFILNDSSLTFLLLTVILEIL